MAANTPSPKLLDQVRDLIRTKHYSIRTENQYLQWIRRFILFHGKQHPRDMGAPEVEAFLSHLAVSRDVAASTQNQALSALLFFFIARCWVSICLGWIMLLAPNGLNACPSCFRAMRFEPCWIGCRVFMV